jgi:hypothetical protein
VPALECAGCHVIVLLEALARSAPERVAIRRAIEVRQAMERGSVPSRMADPETLPLIHAARPIPDESGKFPAGIPTESPTESRIRKVAKKA